MPLLGFMPSQLVNPLMRLLTIAIIYIALRFDLTIVKLLQFLDKAYDFTSGLPGIHQNGAKRQFLLVMTIAQHLQHVLNLGLAIPLRVIDAIIKYPKGIFFRIDIDTGDNPDTCDDRFGVATPLPTGWLNLKGVSFISHRIIKDNVAVFREDDVMAYILPDLAWCNLFPTQVGIDLVVAPLLAMVSEVGLGVVGLAHEQKLAIVDLFDFVSSHAFNYARFHPFT